MTHSELRDLRVRIQHGYLMPPEQQLALVEALEQISEIAEEDRIFDPEHEDDPLVSATESALARRLP